MAEIPEYYAPLKRWLEERSPLTPVLAFLKQKIVPRHKFTFWYLFGGLTLFFFVVQALTGILLSMYYTPHPEHAYESVQAIVNDVPFGWLIRSVHSWGANLMVATMFIHMFSVFLLKAYRKPRELVWVSGVVLMFLVLGFGFTGYLLPWDTIAYFATLIGTEVPKDVPIIGDWGVSILKGSDEIGAETLTRMYSLHVIVLPLISFVLVSYHLLLNQLHGSSIPLRTNPTKKPIPFFPNFIYRDLIAWSVGLMALLSLAILLPWELGEKADPLASAPLGIKPEWYFLPLFQSLKFAPAKIFFLSGELLVNLFVVLLSILWFLIPFLNRRASQGRKSPLFTALGIGLIAYIILTITLAYTGS